MKARQLKNIPASVRQRLLNVARSRGEDFQFLIHRFAVERFLYRLARSAYSERFVLKGATLFSLWSDRPHRPTRDLDLAGYGDNTTSTLERVFREICRVPVDADGIEFVAETVEGAEIQIEKEYVGVRLTFLAHLAAARILIQVDVGFGDKVHPRPRKEAYPTLLHFPAPYVLAYPKEAMVSEKLDAMVRLGMTNSRMKDFFDLHYMAKNFDFSGRELGLAIAATFDRRGTNPLAHEPLALTSKFYGSNDKNIQWRSFLRKNELDAEGMNLSAVGEFLRVFLLPPIGAIAAGTPFQATWRRGGPWQFDEEPQMVSGVL